MHHVYDLYPDDKSNKLGKGNSSLLDQSPTAITGEGPIEIYVHAPCLAYRSMLRLIVIMER